MLPQQIFVLLCIILCRVAKGVYQFKKKNVKLKRIIKAYLFMPTYKTYKKCIKLNKM